MTNIAYSNLYIIGTRLILHGNTKSEDCNTCECERDPPITTLFSLLHFHQLKYTFSVKRDVPNEVRNKGGYFFFFWSFITYK